MFYEYPPCKAKRPLGRITTWNVLQHCCQISWIAMLRVLPPPNQTSLATNQVVLGCKKLLQNVESAWFYFLPQNLYILRVLRERHKANLIGSKWLNSRAWRNSRVIYPIRSQYSRNLPLLVARQVWPWVVKRATSLFNPFLSYVSKQVARFCSSFYGSFGKEREIR